MPQMSNAIGGGTSSHKITLDGRAKLDITGAGDVISFDESSIVLQTGCGVLSIDGEGLHIVHLAGPGGDGDLCVEGKIGGIFYIDDSAPRKKGLFGRGQR